MCHDCICDVLTDLRSHALQNVLRGLAGQAEIALRRARRDVAAAHRVRAWAAGTTPCLTTIFRRRAFGTGAQNRFLTGRELRKVAPCP
jgi:hypothetical protein